MDAHWPCWPCPSFECSLAQRRAQSREALLRWPGSWEVDSTEDKLARDGSMGPQGAGTGLQPWTQDRTQERAPLLTCGLLQPLDRHVVMHPVC